MLFHPSVCCKKSLKLLEINKLFYNYNHLDLAGIKNTKCGVKKAGTKIVGGEQTAVSFF